MKMENTQLLEHYQASNHRFEALFNEHWHRLHTFLLKFTADPDEAEDLCLETFVRLQKNLSSFRLDSNLVGWLYRTATNLGLNALRASRRRNQHELAAFQFVNTEFPNPSEEIERKQEREMVRIVLVKLKPRDAQLLLLRSSGISYKELAEICQISPSSIGTFLARAEREFQRYYQAEFGGYR